MAEAPLAKSERGRRASGAALAVPAGSAAAAGQSPILRGAEWPHVRFVPDLRPAGVVRGKRALAAGAGCCRDTGWSVLPCVWLSIANAKMRKLQGTRGKLFHRRHKKTLEPSYLNPLCSPFCHSFLQHCVSLGLRLLLQNSAYPEPNGLIL